jgi:hypothetical protein
VIAILTGILGIAGTLCAWFFNPKRALYAELDSIYKQLEVAYAKRDKALQDHDSDTLTIANSIIIELCNRKAILLQRLG